MNIAIISDSHDNIPNMEKFLDWANDNEIEMIIHCGDIAAPAVVKKVLAEKFKGPIHLVFGNVADRELLPEVCAKLENVTLHGEVGEIIISPSSVSSQEDADYLSPPSQGGRQRATGRSDPDARTGESRRIRAGAGFSAAQEYARRVEGVKIAFCHFPDQAKKLAESGKYDLVFYGHTHKPWEEVINGCRVINPGTLAGMFYKATFAVYDTESGKLELKLLELI